MTITRIGDGCWELHVTNPIFFRSQRVEIALHHLQAPQPVGQHQEDAEDYVLRRREAESGNFFVAAEHQFSVASCQMPVVRARTFLASNVSLPSLDKNVSGYGYCNAWGLRQC